MDIAYWLYQNHLHDYNLFKNMNIALNKIGVAAINDQWIKEEKDMVMSYTNKLFVELMDWLYVSYVQIMSWYLKKNQEKRKQCTTYKIQ